MRPELYGLGNFTITSGRGVLVYTINRPIANAIKKYVLLIFEKNNVYGDAMMTTIQ